MKVSSRSICSKVGPLAVPLARVDWMKDRRPRRQRAPIRLAVPLARVDWMKGRTVKVQDEGFVLAVPLARVDWMKEPRGRRWHTRSPLAVPLARVDWMKVGEQGLTLGIGDLQYPWLGSIG